MGFHDDLIADSVSVHAGTFGETVAYSPPAGQAQATTDLANVIVGHEWRERRQSGIGYEVVMMRTFEIDVNEDSETFCGVNDITDNGVLTYGETPYGIERVSERTTVGTIIVHGVARKIGRRQREGLRGAR